MRFSLLTPPTDAPSRIPLSRGLPSASALQVETGYLPRQLPMPTMDANAAAAPMEALAIFASKGGKVSEEISNLIVSAEAKKREVTENSEAETLYTEMTLNVDERFEQLKVTETDETLRPAFTKMWNTVTQEYVKRASNPRVAADLISKGNRLLLAKSGEVSDVSRKKFVNAEGAKLDMNVSRLTKLAMDTKLSSAEQAVHEKELEGVLFKAANGGLHNPEFVVKQREQSLGIIKTERANNLAFHQPASVLDRIVRGDDFGGLDAKQLRNLSEFAESRIRTLRSDAVFAKAQQEKDDKKQEDDLAVGWRARISENYQTGGAGLDLLQGINGDARKLGETNHAQVLELHRAYRERFLHPEKARKSDPELYGRLRHAIDTGKDVPSYTTLLAYFKSNAQGEAGLDEGDFNSLSTLLHERTRERQAERERPKTDAEKQRAKDITEAEKTIDDFLKRGSRYQGDILSTRTDILVREATNELRSKLREDPTLDPYDVAGDLIANRIARVEVIAKGLPYRNTAEVLVAWKAGLISKETATLYGKIFRTILRTPKVEEFEEKAATTGSTRDPDKPKGR